MNPAIWILYFAEPIFTYIRARIGAKLYQKLNWYTSEGSKMPSALIQKHFGLGKKPLPAHIRRRYLMTFFLFLRIFALPLIALILRFHILHFSMAWLAIILVLAAFSFPSFIFDMKWERKAKKERNSGK